MRFKGKIDLWFWIVMLLGEAMILWGIFSPEGGWIVSALALVVYNLCFLPFVVRNYVEVDEEKVTVAFGFSMDSIGLAQLTQVYRTSNPIASSAASLDRIVLKSRRKSLMCAVKEREKFLAYLREKCPKATFGKK